MDDGDFLDIDWLKNNADYLVIVTHGLEGNSSSSYVLDVAKALTTNGYDVLAWNQRGCSGDINRLPRFYHSGAYGDLEMLCERYAVRYKGIFVLGYSLGANVTLRYLQQGRLPANLFAGMAVSAPCELSSSADKIATREDVIYNKMFLQSLRKKAHQKAAIFPELFNLKAIDEAKTLREYDELVTAPIHGFGTAANYYATCSTVGHMAKLQRPTFMLSAHNDPFISDECYPPAGGLLRTLYTDEGGHVGFPQRHGQGSYATEKALAFFRTFVETPRQR